LIATAIIFGIQQNHLWIEMIMAIMIMKKIIRIEIIMEYGIIKNHLQIKEMASMM
jgi:hypothetical protein